jgi:hypothetical protein
MEWMWNRYSEKRRSGHARLDLRFERAITLDPTVGSRSNFYKSFYRTISLDLISNRYSVRRRSGHARL